MAPAQRHRLLPNYYHRIGRILERSRSSTSLFFTPASRTGALVRTSHRAAAPPGQATPPWTVRRGGGVNAVTSKLGVAITKSATYFHPYELYIFASLDHITRGRVAWNIVTSLTQSERRTLSRRPSGPHEFRYEQADSSVPHWNCGPSWEPDALVLDKATTACSPIRTGSGG